MRPKYVCTNAQGTNIKICTRYKKTAISVRHWLTNSLTIPHTIKQIELADSILSRLPAADDGVRADALLGIAELKRALVQRVTRAFQRLNLLHANRRRLDARDPRALLRIRDVNREDDGIELRFVEDLCNSEIVC